jgi:hypothetical protein
VGGICFENKMIRFPWLTNLPPLRSAGGELEGGSAVLRPLSGALLHFSGEGALTFDGSHKQREFLKVTDVKGKIYESRLALNAKAIERRLKFLP